MPGLKSYVVALFFLFTFLATTHAQVFHSTPRHQLKRRQRAFKSFKGVAAGVGHAIFRHYVPIYNWEQKEYIRAHNDLREASGVPPLQWNADLANSSHYWANELRDTCDYRHHSSGNPYGENIYWSLYKEFTPTDVVSRWYSEKMHFDHDTNMCKCQPETDKCECGHYLNVVWKTTRRVGCSNAVYCKGAKGVIVVCQYDPAGNYKGVDPLNPRLPNDVNDPDDKEDEDDDDGDKMDKQSLEDHGVPPPPPPPSVSSGNNNHKASNNHGASGNNHVSSGNNNGPSSSNNNGSSSNNNHGSSGNNQGSSDNHPQPPPADNKTKKTYHHHRHHGHGHKSSKVSGSFEMNGSIQADVTHHAHHTPKLKGNVVDDE